MLVKNKTAKIIMVLFSLIVKVCCVGFMMGLYGFKFLNLDLERFYELFLWEDILDLEI